MRVRLIDIVGFLLLTAIGIPGGMVRADELVYFDSSSGSSSFHIQVPTSSGGGLSRVSIAADFAESPELTHFYQAGPRSNRVNLLFMGDGYLPRESMDYRDQVSTLSDTVFSEEPLRSYRGYFNLSRLFVPSRQSGIDNDSYYLDMKDTALGMEFWCHQTEDSLCVDVSTVIQYGLSVPDVDQTIVLANSLRDSGSAYPFSKISLIAARAPNAGLNLLHQLGHSFANLADESVSGNWSTYTGFEPAEVNVSTLNGEQMNEHEIKWFRWLGVDGGVDYSGIVGSFEGAMGSSSRIYRPTETSRMKSFDQPFNLPSAEALIIATYKQVNPIDDATPSDANLSGSNVLFVTPMQPADHDLDLQWYLNGQALTGATGRTLRLNDYRLADGEYDVNVRVTDNTPLVRDEAARTRYLTAERNWRVKVVQTEAQISEHPRSVVTNRNTTAVFRVVVAGENLRYQWFRNGELVVGATTSSVSVPVTSLDQNGDYYWVVVSNIVGSVTSDRATLKVVNIPPTIAPLAVQEMIRGETRQLPLLIADADGDSIMVSVRVLESEAGMISRIEGGNIRLTAGRDYLGQLHAIVSVFDGTEQVDSTILVNVQNLNPTLKSIRDLHLLRRTSNQVIALIGSDPDGDALIYTAQVIGDSLPVAAQIQGSSLTLSIPPDYLGAFKVAVTANDRRGGSAQQTFEVTVGNNRPLLKPIADVKFPWRAVPPIVRLEGSDIDGDPLTYSARLVGNVARAQIDLEGPNLRIIPVSGVIQTFQLVATVSDGLLSSEATLRVVVTNQKPVLAAIPEQRIHRSKTEASITLRSTDGDQDPLTFTAELLAGNLDAEVRLAGNILTILLPSHEEGKATVKATVSDSITSQSQTFHVTTYNNPPTIKAIANQEMSWNENSRDVSFVVEDQDKDQVRVVARTEQFRIPSELDQVYNFRFSGSWGYNRLAMKEKHLAGVIVSSGQNVSFYILPTGQLYLNGGTSVSSKLIAQLPTAYYRDPRLLIDAAEPSKPVNATVTVVGTRVLVDPATDYRGSFYVNLSASDGYDEGSTSFLVTVYDAVGVLEYIPNQFMHWRDDTRTLPLKYSDPDGSPDGSIASLSASVLDNSVALLLDKQENFRIPSAKEMPKSLGRGEKFLLSNTVGKVYAILPSGELYRVVNRAVEGVPLGVLYPSYYETPELLIDVASSANDPIRLTIGPNSVTIDPASRWLGNSTLIVSAGDDSQVVGLVVSNSIPSFDITSNQQVAYRNNTPSLALLSKDANAVDLPKHKFSAELGTETDRVLLLNQRYGLHSLAAGDSYNRRGWRERYLGGKVGGKEVEFFILPNGEMYHSQETVESSSLVAVVDRAYYLNPGSMLKQVALGWKPTTYGAVKVWTEGGLVYFTLPAVGASAAVYRVQVTDGYDYAVWSFGSGICSNHPPALAEIADQRLHWRELTRKVVLVGTDRERDTMRFEAGVLDSPEAYSLDQREDFYTIGSVRPKGVPADNSAGKKEKFLLGTKNQPGKQYVYFILPTGALYAYGSSVAKSTLIATLPSEFYDLLALLENVPPTGFRPISLTTSGSELTITQIEQGWRGSVIVRAYVSDSTGSSWRNFIVTLYNDAPVLTAPKSAEIRLSASSHTQPVQATDPNKEVLQYAVKVGNYANIAYALDLVYNFRANSASYSFNRGGWREKILIGDVQESVAEFAILENGELYQWNGRVANSKLLGHLGKDCYVNPKLLIDVPVQSALPDAAVVVENGVLTVTLPDGYQGVLPILLEATDGNLYDSKSFTVTRVNHPPVISNLADVKMHWRTPSVTLSPNFSDSDVDTLEMTAALKSVDSAAFQPAELTVSKNTIVADPLDRWVGSFIIETLVSDGVKVTSKDISVTVYDNPPELATIANQSMTMKKGKVEVKLVATDKDSVDVSNLVLSASLGGEAHGAYKLAREYSFRLDSADFDFNNLGWSEKSFRGVYMDNEARFAILPNGEIVLVQETGEFGDLVGRVGVRYYQEPRLLFNQVKPSDVPDARLTIVGNVLTIDPPAEFLGSFPVTVLVTDGLYFDSQEVLVTVTNSSPIIGAITAKTMPWRVGSLTVPVIASDSDGDTINVKAELLRSSDAPVTLEVVSGAIVVKLLRPWLGSFDVGIVVSDGVNSVTRSFSVSVVNSAPQLAAIPEQNVHWKKDSVSIPLIVSDADSNEVMLGVRAVSGSIVGSMAISNNILAVSLPKHEVGSVLIEVSASDGNLVTLRSFRINVTNKAPVFTSKIGSQTVKYLQTSLDVGIGVMDPDGDPITVTGRADVSGVQFATEQLRVRLAIENSVNSALNVTITASDTHAEVSQTFRVTVTNNAPVIAAIADRTVHWTESALSVPFVSTDTEQNPTAVTASVLSGTVVDEVHVEGNAVAISLPKHIAGTSRIELRATDGLLSSVRAFNVNVTNRSPVVNPGDPQFIPAGDAQLDFEVLASDPDGDALTYTVRVIDPSNLVYELDSRHNFELTGGDYNYDALGNKEKYIQGTKNQPDELYQYVIYPNGDFYEWRNKLSDSIYLGRLATQYYATPSMLFDVAAPQPGSSTATVQVFGATRTGVQLRVRPLAGFVGQFLVQVGASDGLASSVADSVVEVFEPDEQGSSGSNGANGCSTAATLYHGEFPNSAFTSSFTAEGRIGDSATGPGSRTFELDVSRTTSGPFGKGETANYVWTNEKVVLFKLVFDAKKKGVDFTVDGQKVSHGATVDKPITDLLLRVRSGTANPTQIVLSNLSLNGVAVGTEVRASAEQGGLNVLQITDGRLNDGFILEGSASMAFPKEVIALPKNSELAFQISAVNIDGHRSDCDGVSEKKVTICHLPPGNPENAHTLSVGASAVPAHLAHGDFVGECPGTPTDRSDTCDSGPALQSPTFTQWNAVLGMKNTLELANRGTIALAVNLTFYSYKGGVLARKLLTVKSHEQLSLPIETLPNYKANSQGLIKLEYDGLLDGRMVYRRLDAAKPGQEEFAFSIPLADGLHGETAVGFNTTQPSTVPAELNFKVMNWLSVTNLDAVIREFEIRSYSSSGLLLLSRTIEVYPLTRMNVDGGHDLAGVNKTGYHLITPRDMTTEYLAELTRFGGDNVKGTAASTYRFALNYQAQLPQSDRVYLPFTRAAGETSLIEVSNVLSKTTTAAINYFNSKGRLIQSVKVTLPAHGQVVLNAVKYIALGDVGYAQVIPLTPRSILANSVVYYTSATTLGSVTSAYSANGRRDSTCLLTGAYNLASGSENWLLIVNPTDLATTALVTLQSGNKSAERSVLLKAKTSVLLAVHDQAQLGAPAGSQGLLYVRSSNNPTSLFSQLLRVRKAGKYIDDVVLTPMR